MASTMPAPFSFASRSALQAGKNYAGTATPRSLTHKGAILLSAPASRCAVGLVRWASADRRGPSATVDPFSSPPNWANPFGRRHETPTA